MIIKILVCILLFGVQSIAMKQIKTDSLRQYLLAVGGFTLFISIAFWLIILVSGSSISLMSWILGIIFGIIYVVTISAYYFSMQTGPLTYANFFFSISMVIPSIASILFWQEPLVITTILAFALLLVALYFISASSGGDKRKVSRKWLLLCFISWLTNGILSVIIKLHQTVLHGEEAISIVTLGFTTSCMLAFLLYFLLYRRSQDLVRQHDKVLLKTSLPFLLLVAMGNGGGNILVTSLASKVAGAYLFPSVLGGSMILVLVFAVVVLKEKTSIKGIVGIILGIISMILINL